MRYMTGGTPNASPEPRDRIYWLVVQLTSIAGGIWFGVWVFNTVTT